MLTYSRSREFRQIACLLMAHPFPLALFWGAELTVIYNQAYAQTVAGMKHPQLMGTGFRGPFKELCKSRKLLCAEGRKPGAKIPSLNINSLLDLRANNCLQGIPSVLYSTNADVQGSL